ncbi:hypothetical protein JHV675_54090 [Mycobacterium avium subsp. hominissuis]
MGALLRAAAGRGTEARTAARSRAPTRGGAGAAAGGCPVLHCTGRLGVGVHPGHRAVLPDGFAGDELTSRVSRACSRRQARG